MRSCGHTNIATPDVQYVFCAHPFFLDHNIDMPEVSEM